MTRYITLVLQIIKILNILDLCPFPICTESVTPFIINTIDIKIYIVTLPNNRNLCLHVHWSMTNNNIITIHTSI